VKIVNFTYPPLFSNPLTVTVGILLQLVLLRKKN